jgi:hypothetical protein
MNNCIIRKVLYAIFGVLLLITASPQNAHAGQRGVYVKHQYYMPGPYYQGVARNSGMNNLFLFTGEIDPDGTIIFNINNTRHVICRNGVYVGNSVWDQQLRGCIGGSVQRIEYCLGQWLSPTFNNIRNRINADGTGSNTILFRNFQALKAKLPIDGIQFDDEVTYDRSTMVRFAKMLKDGIGLWISLCPYNNQSFWVGVKNDLPNRVKGVWLQCYAGGAGNNPVQWKTAMGNSSIIFPGLELWLGPAAIETKMRSWYSQGIRGGFVWPESEQPDPRWGQALINAGM